MDHVLRNHRTNGTQTSLEKVNVNDYLKIQDILDNPDSIKELSTNDGKRSVLFVKKMGRYYAELMGVEENGKLILHKTLLNQKKEPYAKLADIRKKKEGETSSVGGVSTISRTDVSAPAISLQSRDNATLSEYKVTNPEDKKQTKSSEDELENEIKETKEELEEFRKEKSNSQSGDKVRK